MAEVEHNLNKEILKTIVSKYKNSENVEIQDFQISAGSEAGENFACVMALVNIEALVEGKTEKMEFMCKMVPKHPAREAMIRSVKIFSIECEVYESLFPIMEKLGANLKVPRAVYTSDPQGVIAMENLKKEGYRLVQDKTKGFSVEEMKLILAHHAKLHGYSHHLLQTEPNMKEKFKYISGNSFLKEDGTLVDELKMFVSMMKTMYESYSKILKELANRPDLVKIMDKFLERDFENHLIKYFVKKPTDFRVIIHGDSWMNNFLFKYKEDGKTPTDLKLVDWQVAHIHCPTLDLANIFWSSTTPKFRENNLEDLLKFYYDNLSENLTNLGYDVNSIYPYEDFKMSFDVHKNYGLSNGLFMTSLFFSDYKDPEGIKQFDFNDLDKDATDFSSMVDASNDKGFLIAKQNPKLTERLIEILEEAIKHKMV